MGDGLLLSVGVYTPHPLGPQALSPLDTDSYSWELLVKLMAPTARREAGAGIPGGTEMEKTAEAEPNEEREQELQTASKSPRINYTEGPAVPHNQRGQNKRKQA